MTAAALKAKEVHEEAAAEASLSLPICTALSPSARSLKIPISASAVPVNKCLPPNNGSKRGSLDSGYADSTNDSNIGIEDGGGETHAHHHHYFDGQCCQLTMWKFQDFSITQILREINFEDSRMAKTAIFAILRAVNFVQMVNFSLKKSTKIHKNQNSEPLNVVKWLILNFKTPKN